MSDIIQHNTIIVDVGGDKCYVLSVVPKDSLNLPEKGCIFMAGTSLQSNIYTNMLPQMIINTKDCEERKDLEGHGISGMLSEPIWGIKRKSNPLADLMC